MNPGLAVSEAGHSTVSPKQNHAEGAPPSNFRVGLEVSEYELDGLLPKLAVTDP